MPPITSVASAILGGLVLYLVSSSSVHAAVPVTMKGLLTEMSDLARLAEFPSPAYVTRQFSSHDPKSISAGDHDAWFANDDQDHWHGTVERNGRTERILMRADGPGAVVRIWSANPAGTLRIYIDGNASPALESPMESLLAGKEKGLAEPIAGVYGKGYNLYLPVPYAKSCEITTDAKGFYYSVDYRTYEAGTVVTSFKPDDLQSLSSEIARQGGVLASPGNALGKPDKTDVFDVAIAPGKTNTLGALSGSRAISRFHVQLPADISDAALRAAVLVIRLDGRQTVEVPLGDFFGSAPGINRYQSLPLDIKPSGELTSRWFMPFREAATIEVKNAGDSPIQLRGSIDSVAYDWSDRSLYFHAGFRAEANLDSKPAIDWTYLAPKGKGRFVGVSFAIDNPVKAWWGEGDEKFYIDGESHPSWFGTGTEDYFGYAWAWPESFEHAYHSQSRCDGPANYGRTSVNRFHILDDVPFTKSFRFDMEIWHWQQTKVNMAVTSYWYAAAGGSDAFVALTPTDLIVYPMASYKPLVVTGAIEGEKMVVLESVGTVGPQVWPETSGDAQLLWRDNKPGDTLTLGFDAPTAGRFHVRARFLNAADYGIVRLAINGRAVSGSIDLYHDGVVVSPEVDLGVFDLLAGQNKLGATIVGTDAAGKKGYLMGLDYIRIEPAEGAEKPR